MSMFKMKKNVLAVLVSLLLCITLIGCGGTELEETSAGSSTQGNAGKGGSESTKQEGEKISADRKVNWPDNIQFPSGSVGGGFYQVAGVLAKELEPALNIPISVMPSGGTGENLNLMEKGEVQMAIAGANVFYPAYTGTLQYEGKPKYSNFRLVAKLYNNPTLFYALKNSGITSIPELKGKRIGVGASPAAWDHLTGPILEAHGVSYDKDVEKVYVGFGDSATQIGDGLLDATISTVGMPAIKQIASQKELSYLMLEETAIDNLAKQYPFFSKITVNGADLPGYQGGKYVTLDVGGPYLIVHKDMPDELVYEVSKALYDNIKKMSESLIDLTAAGENPNLLATPIGDIPFHPGAEKFWKEKNLLQ